MPKIDFIPARDGWHFANDFETRILPGVLHNVKTEGLCGGMVMSAIDYWRAKVPIPAHRPEDLPTERVHYTLPDEASRLRAYIFDRQIHSFLTKLTISRWLPAPWLKAEWFHDWAINAEFQAVQQQLTLERPVMLGLWGMNNWNTGHQVLCYGYETNPVRLYIYDPNHPDTECVLTPVSPEEGVVISKAGSRVAQYRGYFRMDVYDWGQNPPLDPPYKDLVITSGLTTTPAGPNVPIASRLQLAVTVANIGEYPSHFKHFIIWARDATGRNIDNRVGGFEDGFTGLQPGEYRTITRDVSPFGEVEGVHTIGVGRLTMKDYWQDLPPGSPSTAARRQLRFWRQRELIVDRWVDVPESARSDIRTGILFQPGDDFELWGTGQIWAGVWLTGLNGPDGWTDRIETNPNSPLNNRPQAHPFSLVGRFGQGNYFYIGTRMQRQAYRGTSAEELRLRINDNQPANGSGAFRCRVQAWRGGDTEQKGGQGHNKPSSRCQELRENLRDVEAEIKSLQEELRFETGAMKQYIVRQISSLKGSAGEIKNEMKSLNCP